jgi:hypothetical protein
MQYIPVLRRGQTHPLNHSERTLLKGSEDVGIINHVCHSHAINNFECAFGGNSSVTSISKDLSTQEKGKQAHTQDA